MTAQRSFFEPDEQETARTGIAAARAVLRGDAPPPAVHDTRPDREASIDAIAEASSEWRTGVALPFIEQYLRTHPTLFVDDLWAAGLPEPHDRKALGPALREAFRREWMVQSGEHRISVSNSNAKPIWRSLLCGAVTEEDTHE